VLVLNATYEPINVCTVRRATVLLLKAKAEVIAHDGAAGANAADAEVSRNIKLGAAVRKRG